MKKFFLILFLLLSCLDGAFIYAQQEGELKNMENIISLQGEMKLFESLRLIADVGRKTLVLTEGVEDRTMFLQINQVEAWKALETILYSCGYSLKTDENVLIILAFETKVFSLSLPPVEQQLSNLTTNESHQGGENSLSSVSNAQGGKTRVGAKVLLENKSRVLSYWNDLEDNIRSLLTEKGKVSFNRVTGMVVVVDRPYRIQQIEKLIKEFEKRLEKRILVDVKVLEVALTKEHRLGIDWMMLMNRGDLKNVRVNTNFTQNQTPIAGEMTLSGQMPTTSSGITSNGISILLKALENFGKVEVVSQPRVVMLNNIVANIQVGETKSYIESSTVETTSSGNHISGASLNEVHGGVTLQIVGNIKGDDIFLNVSPVVSTIDHIRTITLADGAKIEAPETSMKSMNTSVRLKQGETVVLGGLMTQSNHKQIFRIPFLGGLPLIGKLFSYESLYRKRTELVILITPRKG